ncbi:hypothetical protein G6F31_020151 [Rhizopus arrhizus]|nr:hypothetical protein G6F31_020151 [Rhizopus arrhizus]
MGSTLITSAPRSPSDRPAAGPMIMWDSSSTLIPRRGNSELSMKGEAGAALINVSSACRVVGCVPARSEDRHAAPRMCSSSRACPSSG